MKKGHEKKLCTRTHHNNVWEMRSETEIWPGRALLLIKRIKFCWCQTILVALKRLLLFFFWFSLFTNGLLLPDCFLCCQSFGIILCCCFFCSWAERKCRQSHIPITIRDLFIFIGFLYGHIKRAVFIGKFPWIRNPFWNSIVDPIGIGCPT